MASTYEVEGTKERAALVSSLAAEIDEFCALHADPEIVRKYAKYFVEGYDAYGLHDKDLHPQRDEWFKTHRERLGLEGFLDLGDLLWRSGKYEEGFLAVYFVGKFKKEFRPETFDRLGRWFEIGVYNWAHNDVLCGDLLSYFLTRGIAPLEALGPWRESAFKFQRRAVPVSMLPLLKTAEDYGPLLDFLRPLMHDDQKVVQQGLGWFLREAWKRRPEPVEAFLLEYKDTAPRLIFQYATEKMTPENKARFRRSK